jgi:hypothetical protein
MQQQMNAKDRQCVDCRNQPVVCIGLAWSAVDCRGLPWAALDCRLTCGLRWTAVVFRGLRWTAVIAQWAALDCRQHPMGCVGRAQLLGDQFGRPKYCTFEYIRISFEKSSKITKSATHVDVDRRNNPVVGDIWRDIASFRHQNLRTILQAAMRIYCRRVFVARVCVRHSFGVCENLKT